ncbi:MAG: dihydrodipicolinate synthase family protein [Alistipes sp.]|nr:dihydrodipicolinate synthase family protein [Alistipes sp.]
MKKIRGIIPPMVTPLIGEEELDREGTTRLIEHMIAGGVHALFLLGSTGEAQSLSYKLRYEFVELVLKQVAGRVPVWVGITDTSMAESLRLAEHAKQCGAEALVAASPYYFAPSQQELIEYFTALADAVPLPLYLYNMPSMVKVFLDPKTVTRLSDHPNIVGLKDSSCNIAYFKTLLHLLGKREDFSLYVGAEQMTGECVLMGGDGGVNGGANMFPELYVEMFRAAETGNIVRMHELQERIMQVATTIYTVGKYDSSAIKGIKSALSLMGICNDHLAQPYRKFERPERQQIREALEALGVQCVG